MENPRYWRLKGQFYRLIGEECPSCTEKIFPPRDICPSCGESTLENVEKIGKGVVTDSIHVESTFIPQKDGTPATVKTTTQAIIKLPDGKEISTFFEGPERVTPGSLVEVYKIKNHNPQEVSYFGK